MKKNQKFRKRNSFDFRLKFYRIISLLACMFLFLGLNVHASNSESQSGILQEHPISGKVLDETGVPLPGVSIMIKGSIKGTITNMEGEYTIQVSDPSTTVLVISMVGYLTQEIQVSGQTILNFTLQPDVFGLEEVVIIGYGSQKKVNITGSVSSVQGQEIEGMVGTSAAALMQGRLPGVFITQSSGQPGKPNTQILVRGLGTMNNSSPLILVDGIESSMEDINPDDIESLTVLKDAASASIYGTRGSNGVILITTKRGKVGAVKVSFNTSFGWQDPVRLPKHVSSADYAKLFNEACINEGISPGFTEEEISKFESGVDPYNYPNTDWVDLLFQGSGFTQDHTLNVSGGTEASRYSLSLGYFDQNGIIRENASDFERYNLRLNLDSRVTDWFSVGMNGSFSNSETSEPAATLLGTGFDVFFQMANNTPPTKPVTNEEGEYVSLGNQNLVALIDQGGNIRSNNSHALVSTFGELNLLPGLTLKGLIGVDYTFLDSKEHYIKFKYSNGPEVGPAQVRDNYIRNASVNLQSYLTYNKTIDRHKFTGMLGVSRQADEYKTNTMYRSDFPSNLLDQINAGSTSGMTTSGITTDVRLGSYFGRINYNYDERYLFEANLRRDGSSKFASDYRWGNFPSFSFGWRLSEENFLEDVTWINNLKLRGSWGMLGNDRIPDYTYLAKIALGLDYPFGGTMSSGAAQIASNVPDIHWETSTMIDIGIDADLFNNNLLSVSMDYYDRYTDNILTSIPVSALYGLPAPIVNSGAMRNKGIEFQVGHKNAMKDFHYNISVNVAYNNNTVEKYPYESLGKIWGYRYDGTSIRKEGESWDSFYGYEVIGFFQTDEEATSSPHIPGTPVKAGDFKFKNQNNDNVIDSKDRVILGNSIPELTFGLNIGLSYKSFDLTAFFQGVANGYTTMGIMSMFPFKDTDGAVFESQMDRTIVENGKVVKEGVYPRTLLGGDSHHNAVFSSFWVSNASYLRLKNLQIGYTIPAKTLNKIKLSSVRVFYNAQNLLTFTSFPESYDPEISVGNAHWSYPIIQFNAFGLNINF